MEPGGHIAVPMPFLNMMVKKEEACGQSVSTSVNKHKHKVDSRM